MIYRYNSFKKEIRFDFIDRKTGKRRIPLLGVFASLLTLAIHFILQTMTDTVLMDAITEFMRQSYFTLLFTYNFVFLATLIGYYAIHYREQTFAELQKNHWYLQAKMGYKPATLVLNKILARLWTHFFIYSSGFVLMLIYGLLLKYTFIPQYLPTMFVAGITDGSIFVIMVLTVSLIKSSGQYNNMIVILVGLLHFILKLASGSYRSQTSPMFMRDWNRFFNLLSSRYVLAIFTLTLAALVFIILSARHTAHFSYPVDYLSGVYSRLSLGRIVNPDAVKRLKKKGDVLHTVEQNDIEYPVLRFEEPADRAKRMAKSINISITVLASACIVLMLVFNTFVLILSASQTGREVSISGTIPYIFHSSTMEPTIHNNDLAYFQKIDVQEPLAVGDVVLLTDHYETFVLRILEIDGDSITVDIDNYPELAKEDAMLKTVRRDSIYARFTRANRWLGALIHFANTIIGRILFLLIPSILLFYHDKIYELLRRLLRDTSDDETIESQRALMEKRLAERDKQND